jgi:hypothetical protein
VQCLKRPDGQMEIAHAFAVLGLGDGEQVPALLGGDAELEMRLPAVAIHGAGRRFLGQQRRLGVVRV